MALDPSEEVSSIGDESVSVSAERTFLTEGQTRYSILAGDDDSSGEDSSSERLPLEGLSINEDKWGELKSYLEDLSKRHDEEGEVLVEFPQNYADVLQDVEDHFGAIQAAGGAGMPASLVGAASELVNGAITTETLQKALDEIRFMDEKIKFNEKRAKEIEKDIETYSRPSSSSESRAPARKRGQRSSRRTSMASDSSGPRSRSGRSTPTSSTRSLRKSKDASVRISGEDVIERNKEIAGKYAVGHAIPLTNAEELRIEQIMGADDDLTVSDPFVDDESFSKLVDIDRGLQDIVPPDKWETLSISTYPGSTRGSLAPTVISEASDFPPISEVGSTTAPPSVVSGMSDVRSSSDSKSVQSAWTTTSHIVANNSKTINVLREAREKRDERTKLLEIEKRLKEVYEKEYTSLSPEDLQRLVEECKTEQATSRLGTPSWTVDMKDLELSGEIPELNDDDPPADDSSEDEKYQPYVDDSDADGSHKSDEHTDMQRDGDGS